MKITSIYDNKPISNINYKKTNQVQFSGLKNPVTKCMFVFDLDGTFANGKNEDLQKIIQIAKQRSAKLVYATGRTKQEVEKLQRELAQKGVNLPTPEHLICNNGQFVYENIDGVLVKNPNYEAMLKAKTNFDGKTVLATMKELANSDTYRFSPQQLKDLKKLAEFKAIKKNDPDFYGSKLSYYEWNPSEFMSEYFVGSGVDLAKLKQDIQARLMQAGIKTKFIENQYVKKIMDKCPENILLQSHPLRRDNNGSMLALFICPADKADGVKYLKKHLDIPNNEVLLAGNDDNDISMAELAKEGAYFICVNRASHKLKTVSNSLKDFLNSVFIARHDGAKGILEGISAIVEG